MVRIFTFHQSRQHGEMCGRYTQLMSWRELVELCDLTNQDFKPNLAQRYNVSPSQQVPIVKAGRELAVVRWGLVPFWAKDLQIGYKTINARSETAAKMPAFRDAFKKRRCLVPTSGFFEWTGPKSNRQPHYITRKNGQPMTFAGLWERWTGPDGEVQTCTIMTTGPNEFMAKLHNRMPVILAPEDFDRWLDSVDSAGQDLLRPCPDSWLQAWPVSTAVNKPANDNPANIEPVAV